MSMTTQEAISRIEIMDRNRTMCHFPDEKQSIQAHIDHQAYTLALAALREKEARERPEALTIEQVLDKLRTGDPIWLKIIHRDIAKWTFLVTRRKNASGNDVCVFWDYVEETWLDILDYTKTWLAYAHRPGEAG